MSTNNKANEGSKLSDYLTIKQASELLGVHKDTLRWWDKLGKLKPYRNPMNGYRLYKKGELEKLLKDLGEKRS